jgi:alkylation response protein AidB-like acyl-CoA dehydrogenase
MRGVPWDGSAGVTLVAEWDGHGMTATQSHALQFEEFPATRVAYPGVLMRMVNREDGINAGFVPCLFTAVIVGIVEAAVETARERLEPKRDSLSVYEQVEWIRVQQDAWLIQQAYEGMLRATEEQNGRDALRGKVAVAELAESALAKLCRIMGGGTYARHSPFGFWFEDVRALGLLRPMAARLPLPLNAGKRLCRIVPTSPSTTSVLSARCSPFILPPYRLWLSADAVSHDTAQGKVNLGRLWKRQL